MFSLDECVELFVKKSPVNFSYFVAAYPVAGLEAPDI